MIWYDTTTSSRSRGRNGIVNTESQLGIELARIDDGVRYLQLFDGQLVVCDSSSLEPQMTASMMSSDEPADWTNLARHAVIRYLGPWATPLAGISSRFRNLGARPRYAATRALGHLARVTRPSTLPASMIRSSDVVVSMGADWNGQLCDRLASLRRATGCRVVTMVYDLIPLTHTHLAFFKDRAFFTRYYEGLLRASDLITCISKQTESDLLRFASERGILAPPTVVLKLGDVRSADEAGPSIERQEFFLCVGTIEPRKNLDLVFDALRILEMDGFEVPQVVVAGSKGWGTDDLMNEIAAGSTAASRAMVVLSDVSDPMLHSLYARARALLFPSHYEGWGLPVREAAIRGCPVAAGDSPAVREAIGDWPGAVVLPPDDPEPWAEFLRSKVIPSQRADPRPWARTAEQLAEVCRSLALDPHDLEAR
jgi:glycosyltransferase involved in cell wall biosynthesis